MKKRFTRMFALLAGFSLMVASSGTLLLARPAHAALFDQAKNQACQGVTLGDGTCDATKADNKVNGLLSVILNLISLLVGVVAVIMLVVAGLRLTLSQGDSSTVSSARSSILWSLVGLVVVLLAQVIVRFVLARVSTP